MIKLFQVLCRRLGFTSGKSVNGRKYGKSEGPKWLKLTSCNGESTDLFEQAHGGWGSYGSCDSNNDAGVICYNEQGTCVYTHDTIIKTPRSVFCVTALSPECGV